MKSIPVLLLPFLLPALQAAVVLPPSHTLDWLSFAADTSTLRNNQGADVVSMSVAVVQGTASPGFASSSSLQAGFWQSQVPFDVAGNPASAVETVRIHVFPAASSTLFTVTFDAGTASLANSLLALGGLDIGSTSILKVTGFLASSGQSVGQLDYLGEGAWDPGFAALDQPFLLDAPSNALKAANGSEGETGFAFFQVPDLAVNRITLEFSSSAPLPFGDAFFAGVGLVSVPEPGFTAMAALLFTAGLSRRRRRDVSIKTTE